MKRPWEIVGQNGRIPISEDDPFTNTNFRGRTLSIPEDGPFHGLPTEIKFGINRRVWPDATDSGRASLRA